MRQTLKCNKDHIEARNLLGLVYFEMGEVVAALGEWVISQNRKAEKNLAMDYINAIRNNQTRLETINQTVKKYNQALLYCRQGSSDLAIIQLKKVLSLNPNYLQAHQLLALLYVNNEEWDKAKRELSKCLAVDINNTAVLRYLEEVNNVLANEEERPILKKRRDDTKSKDAYTYKSGNELIIQPVTHKESALLTSVIHIAIGVAIGIAAAWFLIMPARLTAEQAQVNNDLLKLSEQLDQKTVALQEKEGRVVQLQEACAKLQSELDAYSETGGSYAAGESLMSAANTYINNDGSEKETAELLDEIDSTYLEGSASETFMALYNTLQSSIGPKVAGSYFTSGNQAYKDGDYVTAIHDLEKAWEFDKTNGEALYNLGNAYYKSGNKSKAAEVYEQVVELFPNTEKARKSNDYLTEINGEE